MDNQSNEIKKEFQELKKEIQESRKENIQIKSKLGSLGTADYIWWCFEELGEKLDKDLKALKEEIKEEIVLYSKE